MLRCSPFWMKNLELGDQYVNKEIIFPQEHEMARGQEVHLKQGADNNPVGRSNQNPILDASYYEVEFPWGEISEFAANIESMYA